jgi:hypothetical protein
MDNIIPLPGRYTTTHNQFLADYPILNGHNFLCVESGSSYLPYLSLSPKITICSDERFITPLHNFLKCSTCVSILREVWINEFDEGRNVPYAVSVLQATNIRSALRSMPFRSWTDTARYYCLLAQSGFSYQFKRRKLAMEFNNPLPPNFDELAEWYKHLSTKEINIFNAGMKRFPTKGIDNNTIIYFHVPGHPAQYGCGFVWNKRKVEWVKRQVCELAELGYKVCVSTVGHKWGKEVPFTKNLLPAPLFTPHIYSELKAPSKYGLNNLNTEVYYCANF